MASAENKRNAVVLIRSHKSISVADRLPANEGRASRVHGLIDAFELDKMVQFESPKAASDDELAMFHSNEYIRAVCYGDAWSDAESDQDSATSDDDYGLSYDCAAFDGMAEHVRYAGGGTLCAARALISGRAGVAMHWEGGRHHGRRGRAGGFCYVNDVVLGIVELQRQFSRVLYVDLDAHHGDAVQDAFEHSALVTTVSVHHAARGFYPNTGLACVEGKGRGIGHSINIPLRRGASDATFVRAFEGAMAAVVGRERRLAAGDGVAVVVQCGCDGLAGDPHKVFNLTADAYVTCVQQAVAWGARCWTRVTAAVCGVEIGGDADVPEHEFLAEYAPGFDMATDASAVADENTGQSVRAVVDAIVAAVGAA
ncbi:Histone deacetylase 8 [Coemansia erecta]|uniref:Histone deacetylase 8 n=1 Tax=Coemansia erecta TaxID=147472 RepID=A0A9W7Y677_9FUNG|nr:Histone deacetylase 8 [Coemansia erecta]